MNFKEQLKESINDSETNHKQTKATHPHEYEMKKNINYKEKKKHEKFSKRKSPPTKKWGSIGQILNEMFHQGDKIDVFSGADQIDNTGSFIAATDNYLIWANHQGDVIFQHIGGVLSIRKTDRKKSSCKKRKQKKKDATTSSKKSDNRNNQRVMDEILKDVEEIKTDVQSSLNSKSNTDKPPAITNPQT